MSAWHVTPFSLYDAYKDASVLVTQEPETSGVEDNLSVHAAVPVNGRPVTRREQTKPLAGSQGSCVNFPIRKKKKKPNPKTLNKSMSHLRFFPQRIKHNYEMIQEKDILFPR